MPQRGIRLARTMLTPGMPARLQGPEWFATPPAAPDWLVDPLFVHGSKVVFAGASGDLKTWVLAHLALHLAAGEDWLGFRVPEMRRVLYVNEDMSEDDLQARLYQLAAGADLARQAIPLKVANNLGVQFDHPLKVMGLLNAVKMAGFDPDVIIMETLLRIAGREINSNSDMASFWNDISPLVNTPGRKRTLIVSHHLTKFVGEPDAPIPFAQRILGAGYVKGGADTVWGITRPDPHQSIGILRFDKTRRGKEHADIPVKIDWQGTGDQAPATIARHHGAQKATGPAKHTGPVWDIPTR